MAKFPVAVLLVFLLVSSLPIAVHAAEKKSEKKPAKEAVVLMPLRPTKDIPPEQEWEYAATSGGKGETYAGTSNESELGDYAWYDKNSGNKTHPVGGKKPNGLGLYDMSGNVWEWMDSWYDNSKKERVLRGVSWNGSANDLRTTSRGTVHLTV